MATQTADIPETRPKGRILRLLGLLLGSAALVGAGFGAGFFYFATPLSPAQDVLRLIASEEAAPDAAAHADAAEEEIHKKVPKPVPEQELFVTSYFTFPEPLTSNLSGSRRFLQLTVGVSTQYDPAVIAHVEAHVPALTSDILGIISTFTEEQVAGLGGRKALAEAIRAAINARLEKMEGFGGIEDVFFPSFVMQ